MDPHPENRKIYYLEGDKEKMDKKELPNVVREMISASSCCAELKAAGRKWLDALGGESEKNAAEELLKEIREDIAGIEHVIEFFGTAEAEKIFGKEKAEEIAEHAREVKARGGKWCDCPACAAGLIILENESLIL